MRNILEPRIPADVLQSAVPEYVGCGEENLHGHFFALRVYSVIDLALLSRLHCAVEFFQYTSVQHLEDCHYGSSVEHLLKRLRILTPLYPHSTLSIVPDFSTSNVFVDLIAQEDPGLFYRKLRGYLLNESICFRHASHIARVLILGFLHASFGPSQQGPWMVRFGTRSFAEGLRS